MTNLYYLPVFALGYFGFSYFLWSQHVPAEKFEMLTAEGRLTFGIVLLAGVVLAYLPPRWRQLTQTIALILTFISYNWVSSSLEFSLIAVLFPLLLLGLLVLFRREKRRWQNETVVFGTFLIPLLVFGYFIPYRTPWKHAFTIEGSVLNFLLATVSISEFSGKKPWAFITNMMFTNLCMRGPFAARVNEPEPIGKIQMRGAFWIIIGESLTMVFSRLAHVTASLNSFAPIRDGRIAWAGVEALEFWIIMFIQFAGVLYINCGLLCFLGMDIPNPLDQPWKSANFADYWRRSNRPRYEMYRRVYLPYLSRFKDFGLMLGVIALFLFSGLTHTYYFSPHRSVLRWLIDGVLTAVTIVWLRRRNRRKLTSRAEPLGAGLWLERLKMLVAILFVLIAHGLLFQISHVGG